MRYTLKLASGTLVISQADKDAIERAILAGEKCVTIAADPYGDIDKDRRTTIALSAVQFWTETPEVVRATVDGKVTSFRRVAFRG